MAIEIVDLPIFIAWWIFPVRYVTVYQRVSTMYPLWSMKTNQEFFRIAMPHGWLSPKNHHPQLGPKSPGKMSQACLYPLAMTNIAMENPNHTWRFLAGKIIYK